MFVLQGLLLLALVGSASNCSRHHAVSAAERARILELIRSGRLPEAREGLAAHGSNQSSDLDDLWAKYNLEFVKRNPLSGDSIKAVKGMPSHRPEVGLARQYVHKSVEFSVRAADGDLTHLASQIARVEDALWAGDGGRELNILLALLRARKCFAIEELPCLQEQLGHLNVLSATAEADVIILSVTTRLLERAISAGSCPLKCDVACLEPAIDHWSKWEEFTKREAPEASELRGRLARCRM